MDDPAGGILYRMPRPEMLEIVRLDSFVALYHRTSGITHLLVAPAPEILAALGEAGRTRAGLLARLAQDYALGDEGDEGTEGNGGGTAAALIARLDELVACGLVAAA